MAQDASSAVARRVARFGGGDDAVGVGGSGRFDAARRVAKVWRVTRAVDINGGGGSCDGVGGGSCDGVGSGGG